MQYRIHLKHGDLTVIGKSHIKAESPFQTCAPLTECLGHFSLTITKLVRSDLQAFIHHEFHKRDLASNKKCG